MRRVGRHRVLRDLDGVLSRARAALGREGLTFAVEQLETLSADEPALLELLREQAGGGALDAAWVAIVDQAVARGEAPPEAVHPRVAALPMTVLRGEYALRGVPAVPDEVLMEIIDELFMPLIRGRGLSECGLT